MTVAEDLKSNDFLSFGLMCFPEEKDNGFCEVFHRFLEVTRHQNSHCMIFDNENFGVQLFFDLHMCTLRSAQP